MLPFLRLSAAPATLGAALALVAPDARAMGAMVTSPPSASSATELRVALSVGSGDASGEGMTGVDSGTLTRVTRWLSARVHGDATAFALVLPVRAGAFVDVASDAWLEALEAASAPRIVPPQASPPCGIAGGVDVEGDLSHEATVPPDAVAVAPDAATVGMELAMWGFALSQDVANALDAAAATGSAFVVVRFPAPAPDVFTRTVRVTEYEPSDMAYSLAGLPLAGSGASTGVTAYVVGDTRVGWGAPDGTGAGGTLAIDPSTILWLPSGTSNYADSRDALLRAHPSAWLEETAGHGPLFFRTPVPGAASAAAVAQEYYERAGAYGDAALDPATCESLALSVATSTAPVSPACARGALALVGPAAPCGEMVPSGDIAPDVLRCGNAADDLALALSALVPQRAYLTRARSLVASGSSGQDAPLQPVANADRGPVLTAAAYSEACVAPDAGDPVLGGGPGTAVGGWTGIGAGIGAGISGTTGSNDNSNDQGSSDTPGVVLGGISDSVSNDDGSGCGGDSSSASSSGDSCGGDTSSTQSSSGDESSSSGGCNGGGSSSSSSDSGGGGCDGSSGSGSSDCTTAGGRSRRSNPGSRILLSLALVACVLRRSTRRERVPACYMHAGRSTRRRLRGPAQIAHDDIGIGE